MNRSIFILSLLIITFYNLQAQSVGIGTTTPDSSAILELSSTTQGLLIPRLTTGQRDAISNPANGLMILNLDDQCFDIYNGDSWSKNCGFSIDTFGTPLWIKRSDFGGGGLLNGVGFSIGTKGYIGTGKTGSGYSSQFWEYDPTANSWTQKADFGGAARQYAVGFSIGDKGYIGTGETGGTYTHVDDFWEYAPESNSWTQKANYGGGPITRAVGFSIGGKGYIGTGSNSSIQFYNVFYEYDPVSDTWTAKTFFGGSARDLAVGFSIGDKGYIGTGRNLGGRRSDFWEYDPITDSWIQKADFGGGGRENAVGFSIGDTGYIGTGAIGYNEYNDFWVYDPLVNTWSQLTSFPGAPRSGGVGFSIGNRGFLGTGSYNSDFWEYSLYPQQFSSNHKGEYSGIQDLIWKRSGDKIHTNELNAKVGIGTIHPQSKLHLSQAGPVELSLQSNDVGSHRWTIQSNPGVTQFQIIDRTLNASRMAIDINGNVGIGTTSMANKLSVVGSTSIGSGYADIIAPENGAIIQGFLGIGTSSPQAPLHVRGISGINTGTNIRYFNYGTTSIGYGPNWQGQSVIYGEGNICATMAFISGTSFNFSDARIKNILGRSDAIEDLERLNQIKVTRYKHIDSIAYDNTIKTKVIAQELKEIMPEAVSYTQNFIPNIMQVAEQVVHMEDDEYLSITLSNPHDLIPGDLLKCLDEKGQEIIGEVVATPDSKVFQIRCDRPVSRLFVYGKQVDDFHVVDYDAISMLNVSATQELNRKVEQLELENKKLKEEMDTRVSRLEAALNLNNN